MNSWSDVQRAARLGLRTQDGPDVDGPAALEDGSQFGRRGEHPAQLGVARVALTRPIDPVDEDGALHQQQRHHEGDEAEADPPVQGSTSGLAVRRPAALAQPQRTRKLLESVAGRWSTRCSNLGPSILRRARREHAIASRRCAFIASAGGTGRALYRRRMSKKSPSRDVRASRPTVGGPAQPEASPGADVLAEKVAATADLAAAFPFNPNKASEYDPQAALAPPAGAFVKPDDPIVGASTVSEANGSDKVGSGGAADWREPAGRDRSIACASIRRPAR